MLHNGGFASAGCTLVLGERRAGVPKTQHALDEHRAECGSKTGSS